jgi:hypothetical protein
LSRFCDRVSYGPPSTPPALQLASGLTAWNAQAPVLEQLVANLQAGDDDASGRVEFGEFAKAFEVLALEPPIPRGEVAQLWAILDADGGGSVEARDVVELFSEDQGAQAEGFETAINVEEAYAVMADIADVRAPWDSLHPPPRILQQQTASGCG